MRKSHPGALASVCNRLCVAAVERSQPQTLGPGVNGKVRARELDVVFGSLDDREVHRRRPVRLSCHSVSRSKLIELSFSEKLSKKTSCPEVQVEQLSTMFVAEAVTRIFVVPGWRHGRQGVQLPVVGEDVGRSVLWQDQRCRRANDRITRVEKREFECCCCRGWNSSVTGVAESVLPIDVVGPIDQVSDSSPSLVPFARKSVVEPSVSRHIV